MPYRFLVVNENYLGHATVHRLACQALAADSEVSFDTIELDSTSSWSEKAVRAVLSLRFPNHWVRQQNLDFARFRFQWYVASIARRRVQQRMAEQQYDAIWFHSQTAALLCGDIMQGTPTLISTDITNAQAAEEWNIPATRWTYRPNLWMERQAFRRSARIATFSEWACRAVLAENPAISAEKVLHLPPGVALDAFLAMPIERPATDKLKLLFVGGDFQRKGGDLLLEVFRTHLRETCELHLVTGAPVKEEPGITVYHNLKPYSEELLACYRQADVFVLPTRNEAYGHVFIEAMAAGLPVIATGINAIPEIMGGLGQLIPPDDSAALLQAIETLRQNPALRQQMGTDGRARTTACFDAEKCFGRYVATLKELAQNRPA